MKTKKYDNEVLKPLIAQCALRKPDALKQLYELSSPYLYAVITRMISRRDIADELLQDSFINIWNYADRYREDKAAPMTWMTRIVRNKTIDWLRSEPKDQLSTDHDINLENEIMADICLSFEDNKDLHDCLNEIEDKPRNALLQVYFNGLTHQELAKKTGNALGTIKSWIRRSLPLLKRCLEL
jgi:RNA polymerase sigma-70 factor (ECF subfamily)